MKSYTLTTPADLNETSFDDAIRKIPNADFYILGCHEGNRHTAEIIKDRYKDTHEIEIELVVHDTHSARYTWWISAFNNKGPPFLIASVHSNPGE